MGEEKDILLATSNRQVLNYSRSNIISVEWILLKLNSIEIERNACEFLHHFLSVCFVWFILIFFLFLRWRVMILVGVRAASDSTRAHCVFVCVCLNADLVARRLDSSIALIQWFIRRRWSKRTMYAANEEWRKKTRTQNKNNVIRDIINLLLYPQHFTLWFYFLFISPVRVK